MPKIGTDHDGNKRMLECLREMWSAYRTRQSNERFSPNEYCNAHRVACIPQSLLMPIIKNFREPRMLDAAKLRIAIRERNKELTKKRERAKLEKEAAATDNKADLVMRLLDLGYAIYKVNPAKDINNPNS